MGGFSLLMQNYQYSFDCDNCPIKESYQRYCLQLSSEDSFKQQEADFELQNIAIFLEMCKLRRAISSELPNFLLDPNHCSDKLCEKVG